MADVRFGSKADICGAKWNVRFTPIADIYSAQQLLRFKRDNLARLRFLSVVSRQQIKHLASMEKRDTEVRFSRKVAGGAAWQAALVPTRANIRRDLVVATVEQENRRTNVPRVEAAPIRQAKPQIEQQPSPTFAEGLTKAALENSDHGGRQDVLVHPMLPRVDDQRSSEQARGQAIKQTSPRGLRL
jgi:hypothetical protein